MPVEVGWLVEGRVILVRFWGVVRFEDIAQSVHDEIAHLDQGSALMVHSLIDISKQERVICSIESLQNILAPLFRHPAKGWTVVYGRPGDLLSTMVNTAVSQSFHLRHRIVGTREEALTFLSHVDPALKDLL